MLLFFSDSDVDRALDLLKKFRLLCSERVKRCFILRPKLIQDDLVVFCLFLCISSQAFQSHKLASGDDDAILGVKPRCGTIVLRCI